jgi:hypothetical protein
MRNDESWPLEGHIEENNTYFSKTKPVSAKMAYIAMKEKLKWRLKISKSEISIREMYKIFSSREEMSKLGCLN